MASLQLVPYVRRPYFIAAPTAEAASLSQYDPFLVLGVARETASQLLAVIHSASSSGADGSARTVQARISALREAYLELASKFHPDAGDSSRPVASSSSSAPWLSRLEHFNAINAAYRLLSDPFTALGYVRAAGELTSAAASRMVFSQSAGCDDISFACSTASAREREDDNNSSMVGEDSLLSSANFSSINGNGNHNASGFFSFTAASSGVFTASQPGMAGTFRSTAAEHNTSFHDEEQEDRLHWLAREDRRLKGIAERRGMAVQIAEAYSAHLARAATPGGDGFLVEAAFYGEAAIVRSIAAEHNGGKALDVNAVLSKYARRGGMRGTTGEISQQPEAWGAVIDVAGPLQCLVEVTAKDSATEAAVVQLFVAGGKGTSKAYTTEGFWDPCDEAGEEKAVWVRYSFLGRLHEALVDDEAPLKCPLRSESFFVRFLSPSFVFLPLAPSHVILLFHLPFLFFAEHVVKNGLPSEAFRARIAAAVGYRAHGAAASGPTSSPLQSSPGASHPSDAAAVPVLGRQSLFSPPSKATMRPRVESINENAAPAGAVILSAGKSKRVDTSSASKAAHISVRPKNGHAAEVLSLDQQALSNDNDVILMRADTGNQRSALSPSSPPRRAALGALKTANANANANATVTSPSSARKSSEGFLPRPAASYASASAQSLELPVASATPLKAGAGHHHHHHRHQVVIDLPTVAAAVETDCFDPMNVSCHEASASAASALDSGSDDGPIVSYTKVLDPRTGEMVIIPLMTSPPPPPANANANAVAASGRNGAAGGAGGVNTRRMTMQNSSAKAHALVSRAHARGAVVGPGGIRVRTRKAPAARVAAPPAFNASSTTDAAGVAAEASPLALPVGEELRRQLLAAAKAKSLALAEQDDEGRQEGSSGGFFASRGFALALAGAVVGGLAAFALYRHKANKKAR